MEFSLIVLRLMRIFVASNMIARIHLMQLW